MIEDINRNEYLEALKEYREEKSLKRLVSLLESGKSGFSRGFKSFFQLCDKECFVKYIIIIYFMKFFLFRNKTKDLSV